MMDNDYYEFIKSKIVIANETGFDIDDNDLSPVLFPHQRDAVKWAVKGGRRALFESFGLGKTIQQLEIIRLILERYEGKGLIICPLGVKQEFKRDAKKLLDIDIEYIKTLEEAKQSKCRILITNYERVRDGDIDPKYFVVTSLDEASVLRSYGSKTYQEFLIKFRGVPFKFVCTATPSPNKYKELIHYAGYLEIMDTGQALTRFFKRDSTKANELTLYPHKEKEFWFWMSTWALFITKPSDLGYSDTGYDLPQFEVIYHKVKVDHHTAGCDNDGQFKMFRDAAISLKDASREKRDSLQNRLIKMVEILEQDTDSNYILWHHLEAERHAIKKVWPKSVDVFGTQNIDIREQRTIDFSGGKIQYLASKPEVSGQGSNFQYYCHKAIFLGINYKFNDFIQAIHRIYRFLQDKKVEIHIICAESEQNILKVLKNKWKQHDNLVANMTKIIKENGLSSTNIQEKLRRTIGVERVCEFGKLFTAVCNDCVVETQDMKDNSIDLIVTSVPFSNHYEYTPSYNDFGHTAGDGHFFEQMDFLTPQLLRVLKPGRVAAIHTKDRILFGNATGLGMPTVNPFHMKTAYHFMKHGFVYMGMITIETDVVRENNQTYRLGWTEQCKDGSKMGIGSPEYLLLFRKLPTDTSKAYADNPVVKSKKQYQRGRWQIDARAKWNSDGNRFLTPDEIKTLGIDTINEMYTWYAAENVYNFESHVEIAIQLEKQGRLPATFQSLNVPARYDYVWSDVNRMLTLNGEQSRKNLQMHICPLQFDIVDRLIYRYSNENDLVFDPFAGLMTVPYRAIKLGRKGYGVELNYESFRDGIKYCKAMEQQKLSPTLFDILDLKKDVA